MDIIHYLETEHHITLGEQQKQGLLTAQGHILLLAVPGAGKTTVMVGRIAHLILNHQVDPERILSFTFSKAAARDMGERFQTLFGQLIPESPQFMTIHRLCNGVLQEYARRKGGRFVLIEGGSSPISKGTLLRDIYRKHNNGYLQEDMAEELAAAISYIKNMMIPEKEIDQLGYDIPRLTEIFQDYRAVKKEKAWIDFDDMLTLTLSIFTRYPDILADYRRRWDYIHVDEVQDNSKVQMEIVRLLTGGCGNLFMVGDEDQSVYGFRGAYPQGLLDFAKTYPDAVILKMEENFRSSGAIVKKANRFISYNTKRYPKEMFTHKEEGQPIQLLEADNLTHQYAQVGKILEQPFSGTTAVIYRYNHSAIPLIDLLDRKGISFSIREHRSTFKHSYLVGDILAFLALSFDGNDVKALQRVGYKTNGYLKQHLLRELTPDSAYESLLDKLIDQSTEEMNINTGRLKYINRQIKALHKMSPAKAIDCILYDIGYLDFIQNCFQAQTAAGHLQKLQALMVVAEQTKTILQFLDRLDRLEEMIVQAPAGMPVTLTTAHSAKGLEFDRVVLIDLIDSVFPSIGAVNESLSGDEPDLMEEEARLFYVAATRAKSQLILIQCANGGGGLVTPPSRFIHRFLHEGDKIQHPMEGIEVNHKVYGKGVIVQLDKEKDRVTIRYKGDVLRTYLASYLTNPEVFTLPE